MDPTLADIGEFGLLERLVAHAPAGMGVLVGPGDDAAVLARPDGDLLAAADMLVEGRHFATDLSPPEDIGAKALAVNASDIAAMGGIPRYALISFGAPGDTPVAVAQAIGDGIADAAAQHSIAIVGGDIVSADRLIVSVAILGDAGPAGVIRRDGALPGDALCVTGSVGGAAAGLALLRAGDDPAALDLADRFPETLAAHRRGRARVAEGIAAARAGANAMIDLSDGLVSDVGHVCTASRVGVRIDGAAVPAADGVGEVEAWLGGTQRPAQDVHLLAIRGGDDYELAIAIPPDRIEELAAAIAPTPLTRIGTFTEGGAVEVSGLADAEFGALGWEHFRP